MQKVHIPTMMKSLITLVVLYTTLFIVANAAPAFHSSFEVAVPEQQQLNEMAKSFLSVFNEISGDKGAGDGRPSIQADSEARQIILSDIVNIFSAVTKDLPADPNNEVEQAFVKGVYSIFSAIKRQLDDEDTGDIQSEDELLQMIAKYISTILPDKMKKVANGEAHPQSASKDELGPAIFNAALDIFSALKRNTDPNDELKQTILNGFKTTISLLGKQIDQEGEIQSSVIIRRMIDNDEACAHSATDDIKRTLLNIVKTVMLVYQRYNADPSSELEQKGYSAVNTILSLLAEPDTDKARLKTLMSQIGTSILPALTKMLENGEVQSASEVNDAFLNLFSDVLNLFSDFLSTENKTVDPDDYIEQRFISVFDRFTSALGRKIDSLSGGNEVQPDVNNELANAVSNFFDMFYDMCASGFQNGDMPEFVPPEFVQPFLTLIKTASSAFQNRIRGAHKVRADTKPTYTARYFDQSTNAAMVEGSNMVGLSEEAKT